MILLRFAIERGASDRHLSRSVTFLRVDQELLPTSLLFLKVGS